MVLLRNAPKNRKLHAGTCEYRPMAIKPKPQTMDPPKNHDGARGMVRGHHDPATDGQEQKKETCQGLHRRQVLSDMENVSVHGDLPCRSRRSLIHGHRWICQLHLSICTQRNGLAAWPPEQTAGRQRDWDLCPKGQWLGRGPTWGCKRHVLGRKAYTVHRRVLASRN